VIAWLLSPFNDVGKRVKDFCADLNTTSFGKVNTEILWYLTLPFIYLMSALIPSGMAQFTIGMWLGALCAKSGVEFARYNADRKTEFTPQMKAEADVLRAKAEVIRKGTSTDSAEIAASTPPLKDQPGKKE